MYIVIYVAIFLLFRFMYIVVFLLCRCSVLLSFLLCCPFFQFSYIFCYSAGFLFVVVYAITSFYFCGRFEILQLLFVLFHFLTLQPSTVATSVLLKMHCAAAHVYQKKKKKIGDGLCKV